MKKKLKHYISSQCFIKIILVNSYFKWFICVLSILYWLNAPVTCHIPVKNALSV